MSHYRDGAVLLFLANVAGTAGAGLQVLGSWLASPLTYALYADAATLYAATLALVGLGGRSILAGIRKEPSDV